MFKFIGRWLERGLTWWGLFAGTGIFSLAAVSAFVSHAIAAATPWIVKLGPYGIAMATVIGVMAILCLLWLAFIVWGAVVTVRVRNKWKERVDTFNPLDIEFVKKRIRIMDMANPSTRVVQNKVLTDCDIMGPAVIYLYNGNNITNYAFHNTDIIVRNPVREINNCIVFNTVIATNCRFYDCTIYIDNSFFESHFKNAQGINIVSLTGDLDFDSPSPLALEAEKTR